MEKKEYDDEGYQGYRGLLRKMYDLLNNQKLTTRQDGETVQDLYNALMKLEGKVTYVVLGPATTLAVLISLYPDVIQKFDRVIIMGGQFSMEMSNAQFNTLEDPEALEIVANSKVEKIIYGREPLYMASYTKELVEKLRESKSKYSGMIADLLQAVLDTGKRKEVTCSDAAIIPALIKKNYAKIKPHNLTVQKDGPKRGYTKFEEVKVSKQNQYAADWLDKNIWTQMIKDSMDTSAE